MIYYGEETATLTVRQMLERTPEGRNVLAYLHGAYENNPELLGKVLPGLMKAFKKVGSVVKSAVKGIATTAARAVGIPQSALDALAKIDPTAKKALDTKLVTTPAVVQAAQQLQTQEAARKKNIYLYAGIGAAALVVVVLMMKKRRR